MGNTWIGTLVVLLVIAAQVIPAILQSINKKRHEQRAREAAEARRAQQIPEEFRTPLPVDRRGEAATQPISQPASISRADEVAARRKAQLEQLRNRRETRRTGADVQIRTGAAPTMSVPQSAGRMATPLPGGIRPVEIRTKPALTPGLDVEAKRRQQEEARLRERKAAQARAARKAASESRPNAKPVNAGRGEAATTPQAQMRRDDALVAETRQRREDSRSLHSILRQPSAMREAFILKELLDLPVALR